MSNAVYALAVVVSAFLLYAAIPNGFADNNTNGFSNNPTPYNEWNFSIVDTEIKQDSIFSHKLLIQPQIFFNGTYDGSAFFDIRVTNPDGEQKRYVGRTNDVKTETERTMYFDHSLPSEGTYTIQVLVKNTSVDRPNHIFANKTYHYTVETLGFEKSLDSVAADKENSMEFMIGNPEIIKEFEAVHVVFNLPQQHMFDRILIANGAGPTQDFPIDTNELYLNSEYGYDEMQVYLKKYGHFIPLAFAQEGFIDYVTFFAIHENICSDKECVSIDGEKPVETNFRFKDTEVKILGIVLIVAGIIGMFISFKMERRRNAIDAYIHPDKQ